MLYANRLMAHKEGDIMGIMGISNDVGIVFVRGPTSSVYWSGGSPTLKRDSRIARISRMVYDYQEQASHGNLQ